MSVSVDNKIPARRYIGILCAATAFMLLMFSIIGVRAVFFKNIFGYQILYSYQLEKLARNNSDIDVLFVGDSSLGNAVDAEYFSEISSKSSLNLALTGLYGFAGSYNMIKRANVQRIKNVVLLHTADIMARDTAYNGYLLTSANLDDISELQFSETIELISAFYNLILSPGHLEAVVKSLFINNSKQHEIDNDYIKQSAKKIDLSRLEEVNTFINKDKKRFLEKIINYCRDNNINLIYAHGPLLGRYHLMRCNTVVENESKGWMSPHKVSKRQSGKFYYQIVSQTSKNKVIYQSIEEQKLYVCESCMFKASCITLGDEKETKETFELQRFFDVNTMKAWNSQGKLSKDFGMTRDWHPQDWLEVCQVRKEQVEYQCECCFEDLSDSRLQKFIFVRPTDHVLGKEGYIKLEAICIMCLLEIEQSPDEELRQMKQQYQQISSS